MNILSNVEIEKNEKNEKLVKFKKNILNEFWELFNKIIWKEIEIWFYENDKTSTAHAKWPNIIRFNIDVLWTLENNNKKLIEVVTHELTHLKEHQISWIWSTHTLWETETSFEKLQRDILEIYLKIKNNI
jgi:hypothetical protein